MSNGEPSIQHQSHCFSDIELRDLESYLEELSRFGVSHLSELVCLLITNGAYPEQLMGGAKRLRKGRRCFWIFGGRAPELFAIETVGALHEIVLDLAAYGFANICFVERQAEKEVLHAFDRKNLEFPHPGEGTSALSRILSGSTSFIEINTWLECVAGDTETDWTYLMVHHSNHHSNVPLPKITSRKNRRDTHSSDQS